MPPGIVRQCVCCTCVAAAVRVLGECGFEPVIFTFVYNTNLSTQVEDVQLHKLELQKHFHKH